MVSILIGCKFNNKKFFFYFFVLNFAKENLVKVYRMSAFGTTAENMLFSKLNLFNKVPALFIDPPKNKLSYTMYIIVN